MNVDFITYHRAESFGAMLQAYALQHYLISLGHNVRIIDYYENYKIINTQFKVDSVRSLAKNFMVKRHCSDLKTAVQRFNKFAAENYRVTEYFRDYSELQNNYKAADIVLAGSDQIWNPTRMKAPFFLRFVSGESLKASYASSLGVSNIPNETKGKLKDYLSDFAMLSIREPEHQQFIEKITGKQVEVLIDPTLLLSKSDWVRLEKPIKVERPYILVFTLYKPDWLSSELKALRRETKLDIVVIDNLGFIRLYSNRKIYDAGPSEFLWLIHNADLVVTSSFHATVFSIIYKKDFYSIINPVAQSRQKNLLSIFNLESREMVKPGYRCDTSIDYAMVQMIRNQEVYRSKIYFDALDKMVKEKGRT